MSRLSVAFRLTVDALVYFCIERVCLIITYFDFFVNGQTALPRLGLMHLAFFFRKSVSLLPDAVVALGGILNILAIIDHYYYQGLFVLAEAVTFLFGRERTRQRRRRTFRPKLREPLVAGVTPAGTPQRLSRIQPGTGNFSIPFERGNEIHVVAYMQGAGEIGIICLHQFGSGTFTFDRLAKELSNFHTHFSDLYAFDRPGHGETSRPENPDLEIYDNISYYSAECAVRITEFLTIQISRRAGYRPFILVGCGQGALLGLEVAASLKAEIAGLVLISPPTEDAEFADGLPRVVKSAALTKVGTQISSALLKAELGDFLVKRAWHKAAALPDELLEKYRRATRIPRWSEGITALIKNYKKRDIQRRILTPRLITSRLPVLVVVGANDRVVREPKAKEFTESLKAASLDAELVILNDCGHVPHEELPAQVAQLIATFLTKVPSFTQVV